ncbi:MAG: hypothetical protein MJ078_01365 [Clostridia bacterium]|nr:hypothetical protein [Clostridia bacterium]
MEEESTIVINFTVLWKAIRKAWIFMLVLAALLGGVAGYYFERVAKKTYSSTVTYYIDSNIDLSNLGTFESWNESMSLASSSVNLNLKFMPNIGHSLVSAKTAKYIITLIQNNPERFNMQNPIFRDTNLSLDEVTERVSSMFGLKLGKIEEYDNQFSVTCNTSFPKDAKLLLQAMSEVANNALAEQISAVDTLNIHVYERQAPTKSVQTSVSSKVMIFAGIVVGLALPFVFYLIWEIRNAKIYTASDLKEQFKYPVLGEIPSLVLKKPAKKVQETN